MSHKQLAVLFLIVAVAMAAAAVTIAYVKLADASYRHIYEIRVDRLSPVPTPVPAPVDMWERYDVPLDDDVQKYIYDQCEAYGVDMPLVLAIIERESHFDAEIISKDGHDFGLMQIRSLDHMQRCVDLGAWNLLDAKQNVRVGINYLSELFSYSEPLEWVLMAYNGGMGYAYDNIAAGVVSQYATDVITLAKEIEQTREVVFQNG